MTFYLSARGRGSRDDAFEDSLLKSIVSAVLCHRRPEPKVTIGIIICFKLSLVLKNLTRHTTDREMQEIRRSFLFPHTLKVASLLFLFLILRHRLGEKKAST